VDTCHRQVERSLLVGFEPEVREVVVLGVHPVPGLVLPVDRRRLHRDPLVAQEPLVPFEGLAAGVVPIRVPRHPFGDLAQAERAAGVEEDEEQVGDAFESVGLGHSRQSTTDRDGIPQ